MNNIIVVLNYNDYETTSKFLKSIEHFKPLNKIIVVDNCSTDKSYEELKKYISNKIDVISTDANNGYASGNNYGVRYAVNKYNPKNIIISNPDVQVTENTVIELCGFLDGNENVAAVTGLIYDDKNMLTKNFATKIPSYFQLIVNTSIIASKIFDKLFNKSILYEKKDVFFDKVKFVEALPGCFFVIKKDIFKKINYFDERTFLYNEEVILAHKLRENNYKQCILTNQKIIHFHSISINKSINHWKTKFKIIEKSRLVYLQNYLRVSRLNLFIFRLAFNIGKYEKYALLNIRRILKDIL